MTKDEEKQAHRDAMINSLAIRCFRDMGDADYIAARALYRIRLPAQFLWSAQQAVEKYLKCILVLNRINTSDLKHDLPKALELINARCPFQIELNEVEQSIFDHLDAYGENRYLETSYFVHDRELLKLDQLVWHLRQYCRPMTFHIEDSSGPISMLQPMLDMIKNSWQGKPVAGHIPSGKLESILKKRDHPSRETLVWKNMRFSSRHRRGVLFQFWTSFENAPLWNNPELIEDMIPLIYLSKNAKAAYRKQAAEKLAKLKRK